VSRGRACHVPVASSKLIPNVETKHHLCEVARNLAGMRSTVTIVLHSQKPDDPEKYVDSFLFDGKIEHVFDYRQGTSLKTSKTMFERISTAFVPPFWRPKQIFSPEDAFLSFIGSLECLSRNAGSREIISLCFNGATDDEVEAIYNAYLETVKLKWFLGRDTLVCRSARYPVASQHQ
jgi:hypothetical protein